MRMSRHEVLSARKRDGVAVLITLAGTMCFAIGCASSPRVSDQAVPPSQRLVSFHLSEGDGVVDSVLDGSVNTKVLVFTSGGMREDYPVIECGGTGRRLPLVSITEVPDFASTWVGLRPSESSPFREPTICTYEFQALPDTGTIKIGWSTSLGLVVVSSHVSCTPEVQR